MSGMVEKRAATLLTLERGLQVLEAVVSSDGDATAKLLSHRLGLKLGTCYHLLRTLVEAGYLVRTDGGTYDVGPRSAVLGRHLQDLVGPRPELAVLLTRLHNKTNEAVYLSGWRDGSLTLQHFIPGLHSLSVGRLDAGYTGHMHARASCRAVLAHLSHEQVEAMFSGVELESLTENTITDFDELVVDLAKVRRRGHAIDNEEFAEGVACISAPFMAPDDVPAGSYTLALPVTRFAVRRTQLTRDVLEVAAAATQLLATSRLEVPRGPQQTTS